MPPKGAGGRGSAGTGRGGLGGRKQSSTGRKTPNKGKSSGGGGGGSDGRYGGGTSNKVNVAPSPRRSGSRQVYKEHWSRAEVLDRLDQSLTQEDGTEETMRMLFVGRLRINPSNRKLAFVTADDGFLPVRERGEERGMAGAGGGSETRGPALPVDIVIEGDTGRNRALEGDIVAVELLPTVQWTDMRTDKGGAGAGAAEEDVLARELAGLALQGAAAAEPPAPPSNAESAADRASQGTEELEALWHPRATAAAQRWLASSARASQEGGRQTQPCRWMAGEFSRAHNMQPRGLVVNILDAKHQTTVTGVLAPMNTVEPGTPLPPSERFMTLRPTDKRVPFVLVPRMEVPQHVLNDPMGAETTRLIWLGAISDEWPVNSRFPRLRPRSLRCAGETGEISAEHEALLESNGVNHQDFSQEVLESVYTFLRSGGGGGTAAAARRGNEADQGECYEWTIPEEELAARRDFRNHRIFSIDPTSAKDLDDALHITPIGDDVVEVGVHIADVSFFVRPGTAVDQEAARRATSVYLVHKVIPMLPPVLCEHLCSLNPGVERLAYSVVWRLKKDGSMDDSYQPWFGRSVIRSCAKLDYDTAQRMIDGVVTPDSISPEHWAEDRRPSGGHTPDDVIHDVRLLHQVAMARRRRRFANGNGSNAGGGAIALNKPKLCFCLSTEGNPSRMYTYPLKDSNRLVEEYMLLANYLTAEQLILRSGGSAMLRHHPAPVQRSLEQIMTLGEQLAAVANAISPTANIRFDISSAGALHTSLESLAQALGDASIVQSVITLLTHPMKPAEYLAAGTCAEQQWRHYALNIPYYTHFTSPIRRYSDVVVHRLLQESLSRDPANPGSAIPQEQVQANAQQCNEMRMKAKCAQEQSDHVFLCVMLKSSPLMETAMVVGVGQQSFTLLVPRLGLEKRVHVDQVGDNLETHWDEHKQVLTLVRSEPEGPRRWRRLKLRMLSRVAVKCTCRPSPPLDVALEILNSLQDSPLQALDER